MPNVKELLNYAADKPTAPGIECLNWDDETMWCGDGDLELACAAPDWVKPIASGGVSAKELAPFLRSDKTEFSGSKDKTGTFLHIKDGQLEADFAYIDTNGAPPVLHKVFPENAAVLLDVDGMGPGVEAGFRSALNAATKFASPDGNDGYQFSGVWVLNGRVYAANNFGGCVIDLPKEIQIPADVKLLLPAKPMRAAMQRESTVTRVLYSADDGLVQYEFADGAVMTFRTMAIPTKPGTGEEDIPLFEENCFAHTRKSAYFALPGLADAYNAVRPAMDGKDPLATLTVAKKGTHLMAGAGRAKAHYYLQADKKMPEAVLPMAGRCWDAMLGVGLDLSINGIKHPKFDALICIGKAQSPDGWVLHSSLSTRAAE